jgi:CDP-glucose 4,6-dehydratase
VISKVDVQNNFWKGKKVFLTGHTGFKGGWLALWLSEMGAKVFGFSLAPDTEPAMFHAAGIESVSSLSQFGDIRDRDQLKLAMVQTNPDLVFHLAAQPLVRYSYQNPVETYQTNVMGTVHVLDALRYINNVRAVVVVTTDKCYENEENLRAYEETDPMGGHDPYSSSKGCAELITAAYRRSFFSPTTYKDHGVAIATARAGNVIGGGDWSTDRLIPDAIQAFEKGLPLVIRNPTAVRPWQHVLEPIHGYLILAEKLYWDNSLVGAYNFGPEECAAASVLKVIDLARQAYGTGEILLNNEYQGPHEAGLLTLDISKAQKILGFYPRWNLEKTVTRTMNWYLQLKNGKSACSLCEADIAAFIDD